MSDYETLKRAALEAFEKDFLARALTQAQWNISAVSRDYLVSRVMLHRLMRKYNITRHEHCDTCHCELNGMNEKKRIESQNHSYCSQRAEATAQGASCSTGHDNERHRHSCD